MNPWTIGLIAGTAVVWIGYDVFAGLTWGASSTISETIWHLSQSYPIIPFGFGLLMGHFLRR